MYLTGTYDRNLDAKGRLSLPPAFRKELPEKVRVIAAPEGEVDAVYVFTEDTFKDWLAQVFEKKGGYDPTNAQHRVVKETPPPVSAFPSRTARRPIWTAR